MTKPDFHDPRLTEKRNPNSISIDIATAAEIVDLMYHEDKSVADAVHQARSDVATAIDLAVAALRGGGRLIYVGAGTSGRLGVLDATECPPTFGSDPNQVVGLVAGGREALVRSQEGAEDDRHAAVEDLASLEVSMSDCVVGIAASGTTPYVSAALECARSKGAATVFVGCSDPPPEVSADTVIVARVGPEVLTGSTRLKAGTATKMILNMISTGSMLSLGKAYGNLMVDLMATSAKLVDRGERILMEVCGVDRERAREAIDAADGSVKVAIVMVKRGVDALEAQSMLEAADGIVRRVIGNPPPIQRG